MVLILVIFDHNVCFFLFFFGKWNYHTVLVLYNLRILYNVKFIGRGIQAFIRSLMVGGHRSISLTRMLIQGQVSSTPKCNDSKFKPKQIKFLRRENDLRIDDAKKLTSCQL